MLIVTAPVCPQCHKAVMARGFTLLDQIGMLIFIFLFFPLALFIYFYPRFLHCHICGNKLTDNPADEL